MWNRPSFYNKVSRIIIDEFHVLEFWGSSFCPAYPELSRLNFHLRTRAPQIQWFMMTATLSLSIAKRSLSTLGMGKIAFPARPHSVDTRFIQRSNNCPNLYYSVRKMSYSKSSFMDLSFLVREALTLTAVDERPPPFLVYCNSRAICEAVVSYLHGRVAADMKNSIIYAHSGMSDLHRKEAVEGLTNGTVIGIICTDALGLVSCFICLPHNSLEHSIGYGSACCEISGPV